MYTCAKLLWSCWTLCDPMRCDRSRNAPGACPGDSWPHSHPPPWRTWAGSHACPAVDPRRAGSPPRTCPSEVPQGAALWRWLGPPRLMMLSERLRLCLLPRWHCTVPCTSLKTEGNTRAGVHSGTVAFHVALLVTGLTGDGRERTLSQWDPPSHWPFDQLRLLLVPLR